ncbi:MAG TPA: ABC transporter permease [Clostridia bacterium]|nr:ABC transporter permease [Clostridia bacterium]
MNKRELTILSISLNNLKRRPFRTLCLLLVVAILSFVLFGGSVMTLSLKNGTDSISKRLGADMMAVPGGYDGKVQGALLRGEPSTIYMNEDISRRVTSIDGVGAASPQLFVATFSADCCSLPIQLIGFNPETDFVIQPWLSSQVKTSIKDGEIVVGSSINADAGDTLTFFNRDYKVAARLDKTGMGFDTSAFMNMNAANKAIADYKKMGGQLFPKDERPVSSIMIKVKPGYNEGSVAERIRTAFSGDDIDIILTKSMISNVSNGLKTLTRFTEVFSILLWLLGTGVLGIVFSVILNERKKEFGILRALGSARRKLVGIILCESSIISFSGGVTGILLSGLLLLPFGTYFGIRLNMPFLELPFRSILALAAVSLFVSFAVGPASSAYSAVRLGTAETYSIMREET